MLNMHHLFGVCKIKKDIYKVEMVQRRATRWILSSFSPYQSVRELQQQLNLRTLEQRRVDAKVILLYKIYMGGAFFVDHLCYFCLVLICFHARLFVDTFIL